MYLLIVTGMSGAGKTNVLKRLEDIGFFCVDNLPCEMLPQFVHLCERAVTPVKKAAVVIDSRENVLGNDLNIAIKALDNSRLQYDIVFLDCRDEILERRFNETRRPHPLGDDVKSGIKREREQLSTLKHRAKYIVDTTSLTPVDLMRQLEDIINLGSDNSFLLVFESFGYKRGIPIEADCVFDMRFTKNPFYEPELKSLSGADGIVRDYIMADKDFLFFLDTIENMLDRLIPRYIEQGKRRLMFAFGCTGGRHRSVCAAQEMYSRFSSRYRCVVMHRDTVIEQADIQNR